MSTPAASSPQQQQQQQQKDAGYKASDTAASWCRDCKAPLREACLKSGHGTCSARRLRAELAAPARRQLEELARAARDVMRPWRALKRHADTLLERYSRHVVDAGTAIVLDLEDALGRGDVDAIKEAVSSAAKLSTGKHALEVLRCHARRSTAGPCSSKLTLSGLDGSRQTAAAGNVELNVVDPTSPGVASCLAQCLLMSVPLKTEEEEAEEEDENGNDGVEEDEEDYEEDGELEEEDYLEDGEEEEDENNEEAMAIEDDDEDVDEEEEDEDDEEDEEGDVEMEKEKGDVEKTPSKQRVSWLRKRDAPAEDEDTRPSKRQCGCHTATDNPGEMPTGIPYSEVRKITDLRGSGNEKLYCGMDVLWHPHWSVPLLKRVAPHLVELGVNDVDARHLRVLRGMRELTDLKLRMPHEAVPLEEVPDLPPNLRTVEVRAVRREQILSLRGLGDLRHASLHRTNAALALDEADFPVGSVKLHRLTVALWPESAVLALVRACAPTLHELVVFCDSEPGQSWCFPELSTGLRQIDRPCLRSIELARGMFSGGGGGHSKASCAAQLRALRTALVLQSDAAAARKEDGDSVRVSCKECGENVQHDEG